MTNLRFAAALERAANNPHEAKRLTDKHACPIRPAALHRGIGYERYDRYLIALKKSRDPKEEAESLSQEAAAFEALGRTDVAYALLRASASSFAKARDAAVAPELFGTRLELVAQLYKGLADVQTRLATLTSENELFAAASFNAAVAASISNKPHFVGSAYATLGVAADRAGNKQFAIEAYNAAVERGYEKKWVVDNYNWAFRRRDNILDPTKAADYKAIGAYKTSIESNFVKELALQAPRANELGLIR